MKLVILAKAWSVSHFMDLELCSQVSSCNGSCKKLHFCSQKWHLMPCGIGTDCLIVVLHENLICRGWSEFQGRFLFWLNLMLNFVKIQPNKVFICPFDAGQVFITNITQVTNIVHTDHCAPAKQTDLGSQCLQIHSFLSSAWLGLTGDLILEWI